MAMKQAAKRPADSFHSSLVSRYVAIAVRPEKTGAKKTQMSRMCMGMWSESST